LFLISEKEKGIKVQCRKERRSCFGIEHTVFEFFLPFCRLLTVSSSRHRALKTVSLWSRRWEVTVAIWPHWAHWLVELMLHISSRKNSALLIFRYHACSACWAH